MSSWIKITAGIAVLAIGMGNSPAQDALTVAVGGRGIGEACVTEIGRNADIFTKHGLKLEIVYTDGGGETQQAVVSGSAQIGVTSGFLGALGLYSKGAPVRIIGASYTGGRQV
jgi:NitT/TauT family transport system substrate-binding protein